MGCCGSKSDNDAIADTNFVDIPLINKPRQSAVLGNDSGNSRYFSIERYTNPTMTRRPSYDGSLIEHSSFSVAAPEIELSRQQKFSECFSQIEANTFQNIPIMSVQSHLSVPNIESQMMSHNFEDYNRFMTQVVDTLLLPLSNMKITQEESFVIVLSNE